MTKKTSHDGVDFIKGEEVLKLTAYKCPADVWTIGYGHTSAAGEPEVKEGMTITPAEAERILMSDLRMFERIVNDNVTVPLNQSQFDALVSFVFNVGPGRKGTIRQKEVPGFITSTLLKKLNKGDYASVPNEMTRWNKSKGKVITGLSNRRAREAALFVSDSWEKDETPVPQKVSRDVPTIVNPENVNAAAAVATGVGAMNLDGTNPIAWALAIIAVMSTAVFLFLFLKRRGS